MSHYITVPVNENGIVFDPEMNDVVTEAMAVTPFGFGDVYIYCHGWCTNSVSALDEYNKFTVDFAKILLINNKSNPHGFSSPPRDALGIGVHWPSQITEDSSSPLNKAQLLTFYTMEHRADAVGKNAVYTMIRLILRERINASLSLRIFLVGHSFGCKVVLSALQDIQTDAQAGAVAIPNETSFSVVLLQAATDNNNLEPSDIYGNVYQLKHTRLLITTSALDKALGTWYPLAGKVANLFHPEPIALGRGGPTQATCSPAVFGAPVPFSVGPGFSADAFPDSPARLFVADLSPVHQYRIETGKWPDGGFSGSHSDISFDEIYNAMSGFFYKANGKAQS